MSSQRQGLLPKLTIPPGLFRQGINLWPPFMGAGIKVTRVSGDFRAIDVALKLALFNRNYFGTQFGGSMFAMTDPFFALMMLRNLGPEYGGDKYEPTFRVHIVDGDGDTVAEASKTLYIRRRPQAKG